MAEPGETQYWAVMPDGKWHEVEFAVYEERRQHYQTLAVVVPPEPSKQSPPPAARVRPPLAKRRGPADEGVGRPFAEERLSWWLPELTGKQHAAIARFDADCLEAELEARYKPWGAKWGYRPRFDGLRDPDPLELKKAKLGS